MKKSYLILAAVAGLFASCSSEVLVDDQPTRTDVPKAIGFSSYSDLATRGDASVNTNLEYYHNTFAVYGTKQSNADATDIQYVFGGAATAAGVQDGVTCAYQTTADATLGDWKYDNPRYWDKQATYDFIAYAPVAAANPIRYSYNAADAQVGDAGNDFVTTSAYTLVGTNLQATATEAEKVKGFTGDTGDLDLMTSASNAQNGTGHDEYVNLVFKHILAKLNVTVKKAQVLNNSEVKIQSITITGLDDTGTYAESAYSATATPKTSGWTSSSVDAGYALTYSKALADAQVLNNWDTTTDPATAPAPHFFIESLVMPQTVANTAKLVMKYRITTGTYSEDYTYTISDFTTVFPDFFDRCNYTLNFTIAPDVIKFDATVTAWDDQAAVPKTID